MFGLLFIILMLTLLTIYGFIKPFILLIEDLILKSNKAILMKSAEDIRFKNNVLSVFYFFKDMSPNISSFAIIALIISSSESAFELTIIFLLGIIMKEISRLFIIKFINRVDMLKEQTNG